MAEKGCAHCGGAHPRVASGKQRFCSRACYWASMEGKVRDDLRTRFTKDCEVCGKEFATHPCRKVRTCSIECGGEIRRGKYGETTPRVVRPCVGCGASMRVTPKDKRKYCKRSCFLEARSRYVNHPDRQRFQGAAWRAARAAVVDRDKACQMCGCDGKEVHHIVPHSISADDRQDNLVLLCKACHLDIHRIEWTSREFGYKPVYSTENEGFFMMFERQ